VSVFLCYRREDSAAWAGRLCEHLNGVFGPGQVFMDIQDIIPGQDFTEAIERTISDCQAVIVVIGPRWLAELEERTGKDDYVRHEVATALRRRVPVIPVLVGGTAMPSMSILPGNLTSLASRHAVEIRDSRFADDARVLIDALRRTTTVGSGLRIRQKWMWAIVVALLACATAGILLWDKPPPLDLNGVWIARMQKPGQGPYSVRLELNAAAGRLTGSATYPTGSASLEEGLFANGELRFSTTHVPQFATGPATIRWTGTIQANSIRFAAADQNGVAHGLATREP
jgi:hypothetical protein